MAKRVYYDSKSFGELVRNVYGHLCKIPCGRAFFLERILKNHDTHEITYMIETENLGKTEVFEIPKCDALLGGDKLIQYSKYGLDVNAGNVRIATLVFSKQEKEYVNNFKNNSYEDAHSFPGVKEFEQNGSKIWLYEGYSNPLTKSVYQGYFDLKPNGDSDEWFKFIKNTITGKTELEFIISLAFAPILLALLKPQGVDCDNVVIHLRGDSSTGKSTMLSLASSIYGNVNDNIPNGIIGTWNGTGNAILKRMLQVKGFLICLDEFSMIRQKDVSGLLYSITSGIDRDRLDRNSELRDKMSGTYMVLSSGESSILSRCNGNIGLALRILEFDSVNWTSSSKESEEIKAFVKKNNGHAAEIFGLKLGQYILKNSIESILEEYEKQRKYYCEHCNVEKRRERMSSRYGLILLSATLCNMFFEFDFDVKKICDFIIRNEASEENDINSYDGFYDKFVSVVIAEKSHFMVPNQQDVDNAISNYYSSFGNKRLLRSELNTTLSKANKENWGMIENLHNSVEIAHGVESEMIVWITLPYFERIVHELGYEDPKAIRKWLKSNKYSCCEKDRTTKKKRIDGITIPCVGVYLPCNDNETEQGVISKKSNSKIKELQKRDMEEKAIENRVNMLLNQFERVVKGREKGSPNHIIEKLELLKNLMSKSAKSRFMELKKLFGRIESFYNKNGESIENSYSPENDAVFKELVAKGNIINNIDDMEEYLDEINLYKDFLYDEEMSIINEYHQYLKQIVTELDFLRNLCLVENVEMDINEGTDFEVIHEQYLEALRNNT